MPRPRQEAEPPGSKNGHQSTGGTRRCDPEATELADAEKYEEAWSGFETDWENSPQIRTPQAQRDHRRWHAGKRREKSASARAAAERAEKMKAREAEAAAKLAQAKQEEHLQTDPAPEEKPAPILATRDRANPATRERWGRRLRLRGRLDADEDGSQFRPHRWRGKRLQGWRIELHHHDPDPPPSHGDRHFPSRSGLPRTT